MTVNRLLPTALLQVTYLQAAILGIVQGLTEFLPISSTAHLLIGGRLLGHDDPGGVFTVMIQLGAILAVMWLYRERIIDVVSGLFSRPEARRFAVMLLVAFLPAAIAGLLLDDFVASVLYESPIVFGWAFIIGGIVMLVVERVDPHADRARGRSDADGACVRHRRVPGRSRSFQACRVRAPRSSAGC